MMIYNSAFRGTGVRVCGRVSPDIHFQLVQNSTCTEFSLYKIQHVQNSTCTEFNLYKIQLVQNSTCTEFNLRKIQRVQNSTCTEFNLHHTIENLIIVHLMCF